MKEEKKNWAIAVCNTDADGIAQSRVYGTKEDVKGYLVALVKSDKKKDSLMWEGGYTRKKDVFERADGSLYACGVYSSYHIDYTAKPEDRMEVKAL